MPMHATATVVMQVDGGPELGFGHVGRCLALAEELGDAAAFRTDEPSVISYLGEYGMIVVPTDARSSVVVLDRARPVDVNHVRELRAAGARVALLDDPGPARNLADVVIDPPTGRSWPPASGRRLAGFEHALLRREIRAARSSPAPGIEVLVSMGGSDPDGVTPRLVGALREAGIDVVAALGPGYGGPSVPEALLPGTWPRALAGTRLLITRFGHTLLEAAHLGVPAIVIAHEQHDRRDAAAFSRHGTIASLQAPEPEAVAALAARLLAEPAQLRQMASRGRELVDGYGAARVATALLELV